MDIKVLGTGCRKCRKLYDEVKKAIEAAGVAADLTKVEKIDEIASYGVPFTPALVIDGNVKAAGKLPKVTQIEDWLREAGQEG
jgi:small redox-active disulfide protein 2